MRVTICQLDDAPDEFDRDWKKLAAHVRNEESDLVLLPEMPFYPWPFWRRRPSGEIWRKSIAAHEAGLEKLQDLAPAVVLGTLPVTRKEKRLNIAFVWERGRGHRLVHEKRFLPDEPGFWEASWYDRGGGDFTVAEFGFTSEAKSGRKEAGGRVGFLICSDLWFFEHSRSYGEQGAHIIACPRATPKLTIDKWLAGGRASAVVAGAYSISSNRIGAPRRRADLGGLGWIVAPDGEVLGLTSRKQPFVTLDIDLGLAERAKTTYPRYIRAI